MSVDFIYAAIKDGVCPKTGLQFNIIEKGKNYRDRHPLTPSIDKIDPMMGYTEDNIQIVCWWYNLAKSRLTDQEVLELCKAVVKQNS